jgi:hypothetical protein
LNSFPHRVAQGVTLCGIYFLFNSFLNFFIDHAIIFHKNSYYPFKTGEKSMVISLRYVYLLTSISLAMSASLYSHEDSNNEPNSNVIPAMSVVLCVLERNTIYMERYDFADFCQEQISLSKKERSEHCFLEFSLKDRNSSANTIYWSYEGASLAIETKNNKLPALYYVDLFSIFNVQDVRFNDGIMVAFCDGVFVPEHESREPEEKTRVCQLCFDPEEHRLIHTVRFDRSVKSVCGMLIPSSVFDHPLLCDKKLKKEEALQKGFLREMPVDDMLAPVVSMESEQELVAQQRLDQAIVTEQPLSVELEPSHPLEATPEIHEEFPANPKQALDQALTENESISVAPENLFAEESQETHKSSSEEEGQNSVSGAQQNLITALAYSAYAKIAAIGRFFNNSWSATKNYLFGAR